MNWPFLIYFVLMSILEISIAIPVLFLNGVLSFKVSGFYILDLCTMEEQSLMILTPASGGLPPG